MKKLLSLALLLCCLAPAALAGPAATAEPAPAERLEEYGLLLLGEGPYTEVETATLQALLGYADQAENLQLETDLAAPGGGNVDLSAIRKLETRVESLEDELDTYEDALKATLRAGDLSREAYRAFDEELERLDDLLDDLEDFLEIYWDD